MIADAEAVEKTFNGVARQNSLEVFPRLSAGIQQAGANRCCEFMAVIQGRVA